MPIRTLIPVTIAPIDTPNKIPLAPAIGSSLKTERIGLIIGFPLSLAKIPLKINKKIIVLIAKIIANPFFLFVKSLKQAIARLKQSKANMLVSTEKITVEDKSIKNELSGPKTIPVKKTHKKPMIKIELYRLFWGLENILDQ